MPEFSSYTPDNLYTMCLPEWGCKASTDENPPRSINLRSRGLSIQDGIIRLVVDTDIPVVENAPAANNDADRRREAHEANIEERLGRIERLERHVNWMQREYLQR